MIGELKEHQKILLEFTKFLDPSDPKQFSKVLADLLYLTVSVMDGVGMDDDEIADAITKMRERRENVG